MWCNCNSRIGSTTFSRTAQRRTCPQGRTRPPPGSRRISAHASPSSLWLSPRHLHIPKTPAVQQKLMNQDACQYYPNAVKNKRSKEKWKHYLSNTSNRSTAGVRPWNYNFHQVTCPSVSEYIYRQEANNIMINQTQKNSVFCGLRPDCQYCIGSYY